MGNGSCVSEKVFVAFWDALSHGGLVMNETDGGAHAYWLREDINGGAGRIV